MHADYARGGAGDEEEEGAGGGGGRGVGVWVGDGEEYGGEFLSWWEWEGG